MDLQTEGNGFAPRPVVRPRAQVEEQLRESILEGLLSTGDRLPNESQLAEYFAGSRTTVREALTSLVSVGLITKVTGRGGGSVVNTFDHHALSTTVNERAW